MSRAFAIQYDLIEEHLDAPRYECGYLLLSDKSEVVATLDEALSRPPLDSGDRILRLFKGGLTEVASPDEEVWKVSEKADHESVGVYLITSDQGTIPSINAEYIPVRRGRRAVKTLTTWGRDYKQSIIDQSVDFTEIPRWIDGVKLALDRQLHLAVDFVVFYNHQHNRRDCTNMIKLTEDALSTVLGVDDSRNKTVTISEHLSPDDDEHLHVRIRLVRRA